MNPSPFQPRLSSSEIRHFQRAVITCAIRDQADNATLYDRGLVTVQEYIAAAMYFGAYVQLELCRCGRYWNHEGQYPVCSRAASFGGWDGTRTFHG